MSTQYQSFPDASGDSRSLDKLKALRLPDPAGKRFLDVGCNEGFFCGFAAFHGAARVVGLDHSPAFIERARTRFPQCEFVVGSWDHLPEGPFDIILLASALHYADDQPALVKTLMQLLAPGGVLVLEIGVVESGKSEWVPIHRGTQDCCYFPTWPMVREMLAGYAWKHIGPSVQQSGDPVARQVFRITHTCPMAVLLLQLPGSGKSALSETLFSTADFPVIHGDLLLDDIATGQQPVSAGFAETIGHDFSRQRLHEAIERMFSRGFANEFLQVCIARANAGNFVLDLYVPKHWQETLIRYLTAAGYLPMTMEWTPPGLALPGRLQVNQQAEAFYQSLSPPEENISPTDANVQDGMSPGLHDIGQQSAALRDPCKLIAFYLPQYHRIQENSQWWGPGFTEWTNVAGARPNFVGHYQPHIPRELGFYDLDHIDTMREQTDLAREYGVHGFCFHYYWFSGRRILERPLDNFLASNIDFPFCLCWANENWTRTWDGLENDVLLAQSYAEGDEERFIRDLYPFLADPRYIRVNGKPLLVVYRIKELPHPAASIKKWRAEAQRLGLDGLHVTVVDFHDINDPREVGADAMVEFPPHKLGQPENRVDPVPPLTNPEFCGRLFDYPRMLAQSVSRPTPAFPLYRGIMPSWDNTARRQNNGVSVVNATPEYFGVWLSFLRAWTREQQRTVDEGFIFVNAWNEWGEGCHLEPDVRWGLGFLDEIVRSSYLAAEDMRSVDDARARTLSRLEQLGVRVQQRDQAAHLSKQEQMVAAPVSTQTYPLPLAERIAHTLRHSPLFYRIARTLYRLVCRPPR